MLNTYFDLFIDSIKDHTSKLLGCLTSLGTMHLGPDSPAKPHLHYRIIQCNLHADYWRRHTILLELTEHNNVTDKYCNHCKV